MFAIAGRQIGAGRPVFIVAELAGNHNGDLEAAKHMVDIAYDCGADAVKIQTFTPELMPDINETLGNEYPERWQGINLKEFYFKTMLRRPDQLKLRDYAKGIFFSTVCHESAVDFWERNGSLPAYKIAAWQSEDAKLYGRILITGTPIIITVLKDKLFNLPNAAMLKKDTFSLQLPQPWGYSNHGPVENCVEAVRRGAVIIEQHFTLSRDTIDGKFAALPDEFKRMVEEIRKI